MKQISAALCALLLTATACGGGDDASPATTTTTTTTTEAVTTTEATTTTTTTEATTTTTTTEAPTTTTSPVLVDRMADAQRGAETSQRATATGELPVRVFDRFEVDEATTVVEVAWRGIYSFCTSRDGEPEPHATAFVIEVYGDSDGPDIAAGPQTSITVDAADTNETRDDAVDQACQGRPESTWAFYEYSTVLDAPIVLDSPGPYWLMIQAVTPSFEIFWGWQSATGPASLQEFNGAVDEVQTGARVVTLTRG